MKKQLFKKNTSNVECHAGNCGM